MTSTTGTLRALLVLLVALIGGGCAFAEPEHEDAKRPNVVVFLADDQGWGDLSLHGNKDLSTPHIDSLAKDGVRFDRFYVCAVCAPTRAEFLTGRYHPRTGVHGVSRGAERMNLDETTIADAFQAAGYATGCFGKWHNGMQYPYHPRARGFDTFVGFCSGHWGDYFDAELERNGEYFQSEGYITDVVTSEAIRFIEASVKNDKSFFCFVPLPTPHSPMQVPDEYWDRHKDKLFEMKHGRADAHTRAAFAMVENIDDNVGRVLATLDELELAGNTIVIYFSDNGPNGERWNNGMKGRKGSLDEGGVRSALFMRWPNGIPEATTYPNTAGAIDLKPTLTRLAEIEPAGDKPMDGLDLSAVLLGAVAPTAIPPRTIGSHQNGKVSLRVGDYLLNQDGRLYNLRDDPTQSKDLTNREPQIAEDLRQSLARWREDVGLNNNRERRPFTVGHQDWPVTELPARDAKSKGGIKRSSPHPNCSYFYNWTRKNDAIVWDVEVLTPGRYEAHVYYTCSKADVGSTIELRLGDAAVSGQVTQAHDPPLEGEAENRIFMRESYTKDFKPMPLGVIELEAGRGEMSLRAIEIPGEEVIDFRRLMLKRVAD
ncbi:MAG: arylsulfatase [Phycisphaeraceae bacterium]